MSVVHWHIFLQHVSRSDLHMCCGCAGGRTIPMRHFCLGFAYSGTSFPSSGSTLSAVLAGDYARRINATCTLEISLKPIF